VEQDLLTGRRGSGKGVAEADSVEGRKGVDVRRVGYIRHFAEEVCDTQYTSFVGANIGQFFWYAWKYFLFI